MQDKARFKVAAAEDLPFDDEFFDVVVGVNVVHHVDTEPAIREVARVLKKSGLAIFKEPLLTPMRDKIRNSWFGRAAIPKGTKNLVTGKKHEELVPGEKNLDQTDFDIFACNFAETTQLRWHVLTKLSVLVSSRTLLERVDWLLFRFFPFMRRFGDQAVFLLKCPLRYG